MFALAVDQEVDDPNWRAQQHLFAALARALFLQRPQHLQAKAVIRPDQPGAMAMRAGLGRRFEHPRTQPLPAHLHQAKAGNPAHLNPRTVGFQLVFQALLNGGVVLALFHVDEVDHDQTGQIAQPQLARHLVAGLEVGLQRGVLDRPFASGPPRVHVDGHQRLGDPDHDVAARLQLHRRVEHAAQITLDLILGEQRHLLGIGHNDPRMRRHDHPHEILGGAIPRLALHQNLVDLAAVKVADRPFDQIAFLIDRRRCNRLQRQLADLLPQTHQILVVALDLGLGALGPRRADDQTSAFRNLDLARDFLQLFPICRHGDLAGNPAAPRGVGHQHAIPPGQRQVSGQRSALVAAFFLDHLHQHDLADLDHFLDLVAPRARTTGRGNLLGHILFGNRLDLVVGVRRMVNRPERNIALFRRSGLGMGMAAVEMHAVVMRQMRHVGAGLDQRIRAGFLPQIDHVHAVHVSRLDRVGARRLLRRARAGRAAGAVVFLVFGAVEGALFLEQRFAVSDRDLVIVGMNLGKGQKPVAVAAVIDKRRLQRRFDPRHLGQIDVPGKLALVQGFKIELLDLVSVHHDDPSFLGMCRVDKHFL